MQFEPKDWVNPDGFGFFRVFSGCKLKFWVGLGSRSIQELRVGSGFSLGLKVWVGLGHKLGKILGLLWVKALVTLQFSGWVGLGFFGFFATLVVTTTLFCFLLFGYPPCVWCTLMHFVKEKFRNYPEAH